MEMHSPIKLPRSNFQRSTHWDPLQEPEDRQLFFWRCFHSGIQVQNALKMCLAGSVPCVAKQEIRRDMQQNGPTSHENQGLAVRHERL